MAERFCPDSEDQIVELMRWALDGKRTVAVQGTGSKGGFGYQQETDCLLSTAGLSGILEYEPAELVMKALPGTPLSEIEAALAQHHQHLAFEPVCLGGLYNNDKDIGRGGTIGGLFMGNLSGPRRFKSGAARDHILGIRAISGRGELYKSGGMVIKNVTGYDMSKLLAGSWGTLSILSEIAFKVLPAPAFTATITVADQQTDEALPLISGLAGSPYDLSGLAYLPKTLTNTGASTSAGIDGVPSSLRSRDVTCLRLEGTRLSVQERIGSVKKSVPDNFEVSVLEQEASQRLWRAIGEVAFFSLGAQDRTIIKLSLPVISMADMIAILEQSDDCRWYLDAAGGWLWASLPQEISVATITRLRSAVSDHGGSVVIYAATEEIKIAAGVFSPTVAAMADLRRRIKENFDPENRLNPERLYRE